MKIIGARYYRYELPLTRPLPLRGQTITQRVGLIIRLETDSGAFGIGEIAPLPGFSAESLRDAHEHAMSAVTGLAKRGDILATLPPGLRERESFPPSVRFGIECALLDLAATVRGSSPAAVLSEAPASHVPVNALLSGDIATVVAGASEAVAKGYSTLKLKVGLNSIQKEVESVRAVRELVPRTVAIRLDANRAWEFDDALRFVSEVADSDISYIEEPIDIPERLADFAAQSPVPVAVDETLQDAGWPSIFEWRRAGFLEAFSDEPQNADPLLRALRAAHTWVVKPTLCGIPLGYLAGLLKLQQRIDAALVVSSSFESGIGQTALINLAACAGEDCLPAGLDTASWFARNLVDPPAVHDGKVEVRHAPGPALNLELLEELPNG